MKKTTKVYPPVYEKMEDWPIYKLHQDRRAFIKEITEVTTAKLTTKKAESVSEMIGRTIYLERIRIKEEPWKVDPPNERLFWKRIQKKLVKGALDKEEKQAATVNREIIHTIVNNYAEEIVATFQIKTFRFARKFLTVFFNRLLNTAAGRNLGRIYSAKYRLFERLKVSGEIEKVRALMKHGTVVVVPTHFSNLDSVLIGYIMDAIGGLPHFSYAAGLNLFNTGYTAYFMNRIGPYRVDRRKKNPIYLETLKTMSALAIQRGTNSLIFPGGTRSRSGELEDKLKMGLLGTVMEAQRALCEKGQKEKIFVVPMIIGYHFVLEAPFLIEQHLKNTGKERYLKTKDNSTSVRKILKFAWKYFSNSSEILLTFGKPLDVLGNLVNGQGDSFDQYGNPINIEEYFIVDGQVKTDFQREREFTKVLGNSIIERFHADNVVLCSHAIAFTVFNLLKMQNQNLDIFGLLRLPSEDYTFSMEMVESAMAELQRELQALEKEGKVNLSEEIHWPTKDLVEEGIKFLGVFHANRPLKINKKGHIESEDFYLLYYYHNRLNHYGLERKVNWNKYKIEEGELEEV